MDKKAAAEIKKLYKEATGVINNSDNKNYDRASDEVKQAIAALSTYPPNRQKRLPGNGIRNGFRCWRRRRKRAVQKRRKP